MTDNDRIRVKLYILKANKQWDELGTGHIFSCWFFGSQLCDVTCLQVVTEGVYTYLLYSPVLPDKKYRRETNTITWLEADCVYLSLHFQEEADCDEIWEKICQILGKDLSLEIPQDVMENPKNEMFDDVSDISSSRLAISFTVGHLEDFNTLLKTCITSPIRRETLLHKLKNVDDCIKNVNDYVVNLKHALFLYKERGIFTDDVFPDKIKNLMLIKSNLALISTLNKKANPTSQIESCLQELNL